MCLVVEIVLNDLLGAVGVSALGVESGARVMGDHPVTTTEGVLHGPPGVVLGSGLDIPDIAGITPKLTALDSLSDGILVADGTTSGVHEPSVTVLSFWILRVGYSHLPRAFLEMLEEVSIDEVTGTVVEGSVDGNDVTL